MMSNFKYVAMVGLLSFTVSANAEPVAVRHVRGFSHGYLVLKDENDKILAAGDVTQHSAGNRVTAVLIIHFRDGSLFEETSVYSQRRIFQLLSYKRIQRGPAFKTPEEFSLDTSTGNVNVRYTDRGGKEKTIDDHLSLPDDLANGITTTLISEAGPKAETTLSMLVATPKPRLVKLKISPLGQDSFFIGGSAAIANHYIVKVDLGGATGVVAKAVGKQPPPTHVWVAAGNAPIVLKSEGPLNVDGPIWRIEYASPTWPKASKKQ